MVLSGAGVAPEAGASDLDLAPMADAVSDYLKRRGKTEICLGSFQGPPQSAASAGPGIAKALSEQLSRQGIEVKRRADWGLVGEYRLGDLAEAGKPAAQIEVRILDLTGMAIYSGTWDVPQEPATKSVVTGSQKRLAIRDPEATVASLFGATVQLPVHVGRVERGRALLHSLQGPRSSIDGTEVAAAPDSPYAVEVLVADGEGRRPLQPHDEDGLAFVDIPRDALYAVNLINDSDTDAAVTLTIDGLSMFAFSENESYSYVIVPKKSRSLIEGWHITNADSRKFLVTEYAQTAVARLGAGASDLGTITARFAAAYPPGVALPEDERTLMAKNTRGEVIGTGLGAEVAAVYREVERNVGPLRATVSVRYTKTAD